MTTKKDHDLFYTRHVFMCTNERADGHVRGCCKQRGAVELRGYMKDACKKLGKRTVRINNAGCLDRCELGPTLVIYPEGVWYTFETEADIDEIIETHLIGGDRVDRLILDPSDNFPDQRAARLNIADS